MAALKNLLALVAFLGVLNVIGFQPTTLCLHTGAVTMSFGRERPKAAGGVVRMFSQN